MMNADRAPRSSHQLVMGTFATYRRHPLLFLALAAGVVVPYQLIVLAATGSGPLERSDLGIRVELLLTLIEWALIGPLVSALHVHAVREVRDGRDPRLLPVAREGLRVLPVVVAAAIISGLGIALGFVAFIIPGFILMLRWYVVAQSAAIEDEGWLPALRRSHQLTAGNYGHVFVFAIYVGLIVAAPTLLLGFVFGDDSTTVASFLVVLAVEVLTLSFGALAAALLYFDLRVRHESSAVPALAGGSTPAGNDPRQANHSLDPRKYSDQDRPKGWYVDPSLPKQMRYWGAGDPPGWGGATRTPRKIRQAWRARDPEQS